MKTARSHAAFTLVELMIVIAIVAALSTIATVAYRRHIRKGYELGMMTFISTIQARQETYFQQFGSYCNASMTGEEVIRFDPPLQSGEPQAKKWEDLPANWSALGVRPEGDVTYASYFVRASFPPNHTPSGWADQLNIPNTGQAWYYVVAHADFDGDASYTSGGCMSNGPIPLDCTSMTASSTRSTIATYNSGE